MVRRFSSPVCRVMPKVERLPSGSYRVRFVDPWGRRAVITRKTAADTRAAYKRALGDMARGEYVDPRHGRTTLADWAEDWLTGARNLGPGGRDMYRQALMHILPQLGNLPLGKLSAGDIDRYLEAKLDTLAPSTVHRHYRVLHRMLAVAVDRHMIPRNPCQHVQPPKVPRPELTVLDVGQVDKLADAITPRYRAWVYVAAYGGLRWSETVGLRRKNVQISRENPRGHSLTTARLAVVEQLVRRRDGTWDRGQTKTGNVRTVTLPGFAADELAAHLDQYAQPDPDGLVFPTRNGTPMYGGSWTSNVFKRALQRAGLPDIRIHDLRHTSVSLALEAGGRLEVVQERHGHSSIRVTSDVYGHTYAGADETVAAALDDLHAKAQRARLRVV